VKQFCVSCSSIPEAARSQAALYQDATYGKNVRVQNSAGKDRVRCTCCGQVAGAVSPGEKVKQ
jgi:hypothetical protein